MRVLIVDDVPDDRQLVRREVEALYPGAVTLELATLRDLDAALAGDPIDLVVSDLALRWGSGREVLRRVKAEQPDCPVVIFTGSGDETTAVELLKAGLDDYVVKSTRQLPRLRTSLKVVVEAARRRTDLTEREARLTAALAHKETIVRALHNRVKNNLQMITSLLQIRSRKTGGELAAELDELCGRMHALSAVQMRIHEAEGYDLVDFRSVLSDMAESLMAFRSDCSVELVRDFDGPLELDSQRAIPLVLLCHEVILNALKHAWPDGREGRLVVTLRTAGDHPEISIVDDGIGFDDAEVRKGMGSRLTLALAGQANVELRTVSQPDEGVTVSLRLG